jgi:multiple sugar transport system substrate-binding protein
MKLRRKIIVGIMLTLLILSMLTFAFNIQPVNSEPVTITVIGGWTGVEMDAFLPVLQAFENQTGISVNYTYYSYWDLLTLLPEQFAAGTTPGDVIFMGSRFIKEKGQEGHIIDVTSLIDEANFSAGALGPVKVCDTLYGGAYTGKVKPGFWYRKSFFAAHNLTEPTNWAEFLALLDDIAGISGIENPIASGDGVGWPLSDVTEHFLITFGGPQLHRNLTAGTVAWNSSQVRTIFADRLVPLLQGNFSDPIEWTTALDLWWNETYGLYFMGSWITGMVDNATDLGVFSLPGNEGLVFNPDTFFIPAYTEHLEEAIQLFLFLAGAEGQTLQVEQGGHIATNLGVPLDAYPAVDRMVVNLTTGKELLYDLDDAIGGVFQTTFWDQLKLLWVDPESLDDVLNALEAVAPRTILVPTHYPTIQEAINAASPGATIYVCSGTYYENVVVNKALTLIGEGRSTTIINGNGLNYTGALVAIVADNVDMSGFTVTNALHQGIEVGDSQHCEVHDNIVCFTGDRGIVFGGPGNNKAYNNVVHNSSAYGGIEAIYSDNNTIYNNTAYFNQWGIATNHGSYNHIYNNKVHSNRGAGIHIDWPSTDNIIYNNDISSNTNTGIRVINQANRTEIFGNKISENFCGIQLENSFANNISGNYIVNNAAAVTLVSSENNTVYHNNFIGNGWQVHIQPSRFNIWDYGYPSGGNYWSDYTGLDLYSGPYQNETGSDGIGDIPYVIDANNTDRYPLMRTHYYEDRMTQVVSTESADNSEFTSLAVGSDGTIHIAWHDDTDYGGSGTDKDIFYKRFEVGVGWTATEVVSTESTSDSFRPSLAVDLAGNVHIAWEDDTDYAGSGTDADIFYKRFEVGVGWTATEVVSTESTQCSARPSLAVDSSGKVHIAWFDETIYAGSGPDWDIFYKSKVAPWTWTSTEVVSAESTDNSAWPSLAVDLTGNVHIAWFDYTDYAGSGTDVDVFYKRHDVGVGWTYTAVVSTESTSDSHYPSLAVDSSGNVHIAWEDDTDYAGSGTDADIFYKRFEVGVGWTATEVVSTNSTSGSACPSLAIDSSGNIHIAWHDWTNYGGAGPGESDIFYKRFEAGLGWTATEVVSTESTSDSHYPSLAVDSSGNVHIAWYDGTDYAGCGTDFDIFYKYLHLHSTQYPWPMFRHNLRHTGYTESPAPNTNQTQWTYTTSGNVYSSPAVADGMVFVGSNDGNVYALDQHTGAHIWNYSTGSAVMSSPAVADGKVYVGSNDSKVYALDQYTGAHIWNYTTGGWITSSPAVADGKVFVGSFDGKVYCLDAATGAHIWNYSTGGLGWSSPAVADGKVYIGSGDGKVYCLDVATGAHIWNYTTGGWITSSPTVVDGMVFVGSNDGNVYALDQHTGAHIWNYSTGDRVYSSPAVADGKVYVGSRDNKTYCLDASTGTFIWTYTTSNLVSSSPAVADGKVYVGSKDNKIYCLDAATGAHVWSYTTGDCVESSPAVADGMVFVGSYDHVVYAFGNVIRVPEDYSTIQEAIDAADPGATIMVASGLYHESLVINKPVTIIGRTGSGPIHEGGGSGIAVIITDTSEVTIINFVITNWDQGMLIVNSSDCKIYGNIFQENNIAINLTETSIINTIYWNNFIDNSVQVITETSMNIWDNDYPDGGNYWSTHISEDLCSGPNQNEPGSDGIFDTQYTIVGNNIDRYPLVKPFSPHDIGITNITTSKTVVGQGYQLNITAKILNYGINTETFTITLYAHTEVITQTQITLKSRNSTTITFTWNTTGVPYGNYTISAYATPVDGETDTTDNTKGDDMVLVTIPGDVNGDRKVSVSDLVRTVNAVPSTPTINPEKWDPNADINCDGKVSTSDVVICVNYIPSGPW